MAPGSIFNKGDNMTRLTKKDLAGLAEQMAEYDKNLIRITGASLNKLASFAAGISEDVFLDKAAEARIAVVPVTSGEGVIEGFVQLVYAIIKHMGFTVYITEASDVSGLAEAVDSGADIVFMADDLRFIALNLASRTLADNAEATGRGFAAALNAMANDLADQEVLLIGAGPVGTKALEFLANLGARVSVCEIDKSKAKELQDRGIKVEEDLKEALPRYKFILEATPQADIIKPESLHPAARIAAPGVPLGLTNDAVKACQDRLVHDPLHLGVAAMLAMALREEE